LKEGKGVFAETKRGTSSGKKIRQIIREIDAAYYPALSEKKSNEEGKKKGYPSTLRKTENTSRKRKRGRAGQKENRLGIRPGRNLDS